MPDRHDRKRIAVHFPGGQRFLPVEIDTWACRGFRPKHPLEVPPLTDPASLGGEQAGGPDDWLMTRDKARAYIRTRNAKLLAAWDEETSLTWWIVVEVGQCELPYFISVELTGEMGSMSSLQSEPLRLVRFV